ncbi:hypothetical protein MOMA_06011 [Moraxella macacae 0408225]|uniref:Uncharacterized protein n=2 Tax=Moraxella macacae TaxID=765840 RepID=L2F509_9GAMM|nr:hypothetical protein MOMA_06011 [Moraxella macacae 0408225]
MTNSPDIISLNCEQAVGHADHWACFTNNISQDIPKWLAEHIDSATLPTPLKADVQKPCMLLSGNQAIHLNQVIEIDEQGRPLRFVNAYPCINSPYTQWAVIESVYHCKEQVEAILRLKLDDGTILYAFDTCYAMNAQCYEKNQRYRINLGALAYQVKPSNRSEVIVVDQPDAIRYHRAFNDILAKNNNVAPMDLEDQIAKWQPDPADLPLEPIEINVGNMCAYLFGDTLGQQDEAWCQGQVVGKQTTAFDGIEFVLLDVVILRESLENPVVIRMAVNVNDMDKSIEVNDYIQANIWLQATIYQKNQTT